MTVMGFLNNQTRVEWKEERKKERKERGKAVNNTYYTIPYHNNN